MPAAVWCSVRVETKRPYDQHWLRFPALSTVTCTGPMKMTSFPQTDEFCKFRLRFKMRSWPSDGLLQLGWNLQRTLPRIFVLIRSIAVASFVNLWLVRRTTSIFRVLLAFLLAGIFLLTIAARHSQAYDRDTKHLQIFTQHSRSFSNTDKQELTASPALSEASAITLQTAPGSARGFAGKTRDDDLLSQASA